MSEHATLRQIVETHIAKARSVDAETQRVEIKETREHQDEHGQSLMLKDRVDVTMARVAAEEKARIGQAKIEARVAELGDAIDVIRGEQDRLQGLLTVWRKANDHLHAQHGEHAFLGLSTADELEQAVVDRDAEIARLKAMIDGKDV